MRAGETAAEIAVRGSTDNTPPVDANALTVIQRAIAGLDAVTNERPTARATSDESDAELRARARDALISSNKGTLGALRNGLLQLPEVRDVKIIEMPNGVPGEVTLNVSLAQNVTTQGNELPDAVKACIEDLRPAGIRIVGGKAGTVDLAAKVQLTLAGSQLAKAEVSKVQDQVRKTLVGEVARRGVGDRVRIKPMVAAVLKDERIVDADILLAIKGSAPAGTDLDPPADAAVQLDAANISFNPETFDQPLPAGQTVPLDISAKVGALLQGTVTATQAQSLLTAKLKSAFGSVAADTSVDINFLLNALRDDANYTLDPMKLQVTLTSPQQFVQIMQGSGAFRVLAAYRFNVRDVEVSP
jgi:hypothetical protein